ncbi:MAG: glycosyltransferase [Candidatus Omnitrophica bacterium]|nr:glycosyltransferase [Candidatus Omnitrophota bacterium]
MFDDRSKKFKNQYVPLKRMDVDKYIPFVGKDKINHLKFLAEPLLHKVWANVNSTIIGGGVAEMLQSTVPFAKGLGVDCRWFVIEGTPDFFQVTKKFHNLLQGVKQDITMEEVFHAYLDTLNWNTEKTKIVGHLVVIHDPQPAAIVMSGNVYGHILWRCHIDTSQASRRIWRFLLPYINHFDGAIFTANEFIKEQIQVPAYEVHPSIDPLRKKNHLFTKKEARDILSDLFNEHNIDPHRPIVLAVSRYDIHKNQKGIIRAFKLLKTTLSKKIKPYLIIVGNTASDDPEGEQMYAEIEKEIGGDKDIQTWLNIKNNDEAIGALMSLADCFVHLSTKEGFGLVVTEAMWQKTPVIGSKIGGIKLQVIDGETGYLVEPSDYKLAAKKIQSILENPAEKREFGRQAHEHVRNNFLLPSLVEKYLILMRYYLEIDNKIPPFRLNELTYKEIKSALYGRTVWPFSSNDLKKKIETILEGML